MKRQLRLGVSLFSFGAGLYLENALNQVYPQPCKLLTLSTGCTYIVIYAPLLYKLCSIAVHCLCSIYEILTIYATYKACFILARCLQPIKYGNKAETTFRRVIHNANTFRLLGSFHTKLLHHAYNKCLLQ